MKRKIHRVMSCDGKRQFLNYKDAQDFIKQRYSRPHRKRHNPGLAAYKCHHCSFFHIGNNRARKSRGWGHKRRLAALNTDDELLLL